MYVALQELPEAFSVQLLLRETGWFLVDFVALNNALRRRGRGGTAANWIGGKGKTKRGREAAFVYYIVRVRRGAALG